MIRQPCEQTGDVLEGPGREAGMEHFHGFEVRRPASEGQVSRSQSDEGLVGSDEGADLGVKGQAV
ncbi:hypothetical protein D3C72_829330 [compost metagenome]